MTKSLNDPISESGIGSIETRIRELMQGSSLRQFSIKVGMSEGAIRKILQGSIPSLDSAFKIASACDVSIDWLATGSRTGSLKSSQSSRANVISMDEFDEEFCLVPGFNIQVSAGDGCNALDEEPKRWLAYRRKYLQYKGLTPERCAVVFVRGDSMATTITDNDSLLIDRDSTTPIDGHIYVLRLGDELYAKRLQKSFDGSITLISDNKEYAPIHVPLDKLSELCIVGKVVQRATDL